MNSRSKSNKSKAAGAGAARKPAARKSVPADKTKAAAPTRKQKPVVEEKKKKASDGASTENHKREKLVRDSFTMPRDDFALIDLLKARALEFKRPTKKSELLRAGLQALSRLDSNALQATLGALRPLKAGRPKKRR